MTLRYSASSESCWRDCPRRWWWRYRHAYRLAEKPEALAAGIAWHDMLDRLGEDPPEPATRREAMLSAMLLGYRERWQGSFGGKLTSIEERFQMRMLDQELDPVEGWQVVGFIDKLVEIDGEPWIVEHKTTSQDISSGSDYWKRLYLDPQLTTYWMGCQKALGIQPAGILYDVARKPALVPHKERTRKGKLCIKKCPGASCERCQGSGWQQQPGATPAETLTAYRDRMLEAIRKEPSRYYHREKVRRLDSQVIQHMQSMAFYARQMERSIRENFAPQNPDACNRWGQCEFWAVCCAGKDATPADVPGMFEQGKPMQLPKTVVAEPTEEWF